MHVKTHDNTHSRREEKCSERIMPMSFIDSPFCSKVAYEAWLKLPAEEQQAALDAKGVDSLTEAAESLAVSEDAAPTKIGAWEPLTYPEDRVALIKKQFDDEAGSHGRLPIKRVHTILFTDFEKIDYNFDTFDEDLQATCEDCGKTMAWADVQKFLEENL
jgi:hypothetical protein